MKIIFLGTCSGTEPIPGYKHLSFVIEEKGNVYWFDAGESCSYTAHCLGVDLLSIKTIFISHTHMDHIGGLANLLWNIRKLNEIVPDKTLKISGKTIKIFIPNLSAWQGILQMLGETEDKFKTDFHLEAKSYQDGIIYNDKIIQVIALHNQHLGKPKNGKPWASFSFRIETNSKSVVFSGDLDNIKELTPILDNCNLLLIETGHHKVDDICTYLRDSKKNFDQLGFIHHGREILADSEQAYKKACKIINKKVLITKDQMILNL